MDWFRSWHGAPTDPKWLLIARKAGTQPGVVSALFWALLDHASQNTPRGSVTGFDAETYALYSGFPEEDIIAAIAAMTEKGMIGPDGRLAAWDERQPKREDNSAERTRQYRQRQQDVTHGDAAKRSVTHGDADDDLVFLSDERSDQIRSEGDALRRNVTQCDAAKRNGKHKTADELALIETKHGEVVGGKISLDQAQAYQDWLKITTAAAVIDALNIAAERARTKTKRYAYAMTTLENKRAEGKLPKAGITLDVEAPDEDALSWM